MRQQGMAEHLQPVALSPGATGGRAASRLSRSEFGARFDAVAAPLWCIAAAMVGDRHRAEDVVQEAAVVALGKLDEFDGSTNFLAWMSQIVRYIGLNERRRTKRNAAVPLDPAEAQRPGARTAVADVLDARSSVGAQLPSAVSASGELREDLGAFDDEVMKGLKLLDHTARACLLLRTVMDMPYREIALALDVPEGTAMSHVHRSKRVLRDHLASLPPQPRTGSTPPPTSVVPRMPANRGGPRHA